MVPKMQTEKSPSQLQEKVYFGVAGHMLKEMKIQGDGRFDISLWVAIHILKNENHFVGKSAEQKIPKLKKK